MANKNYNSTLQSNNTDLQAILNTINELPGAGGGSENLTDVLDTQEAKLNELLTILDGKTAGGGSGSVETCTVTFDNESISNDCRIRFVMATVLENGVEKPYLFAHDYPNNDNPLFYLTIPNVICGTPIYLGTQLYNYRYNGVYTEIDGSATVHSTTQFNSDDDVVLAFTAPSVAGENCTIYYCFGA